MYAASSTITWAPRGSAGAANDGLGDDTMGMRGRPGLSVMHRTLASGDYLIPKVDHEIWQEARVWRVEGEVGESRET